MAAVRRQRLMIGILDAIRSMKEANGSTVKKIISFMKSNSPPQGPKSHIASRVRKVIKEAVNGGILRSCNGLFKMDVTYEVEVNRTLRESLSRATRRKKRSRSVTRTGRRYIHHRSKRRRKQRGRLRRRRSHHRRRRGRLLCRKVVRRYRPRQKRPREVVTAAAAAAAAAAATPWGQENDSTLRGQSPSVKEYRGGRRKRQPSYRFNKTIINKVFRLRPNAKVNRPSRMRVRKWVGECSSFPLDEACAEDITTLAKTNE